MQLIWVVDCQNLVERCTWVDVVVAVHVPPFRNHGGDVEALPRGFDGGDPGLEDAPGPRHGRAVRVDEEERPDAGWQEDGFREGRLEDVASELTQVVLVICERADPVSRR